MPNTDTILNKEKEKEYKDKKKRYKIRNVSKEFQKNQHINQAKWCMPVIPAWRSTCLALIQPLTSPLEVYCPCLPQTSRCTYVLL
jgi:hypothetical protein